MAFFRNGCVHPFVSCLGFLSPWRTAKGQTHDLCLGKRAVVPVQLLTVIRETIFIPPPPPNNIHSLQLVLGGSWTQRRILYYTVRQIETGHEFGVTNGYIILNHVSQNDKFIRISRIQIHVFQKNRKNKVSGNFITSWKHGLVNN